MIRSGETIADALSIDVLIVGGGVQGLWLLGDLTARGYAALLVERRELGGEQTCHSHVYIHHGHLYQEDQGGLAAHLDELRTLWREWLTAHRVDTAAAHSCFGFQSPADAAQKVNLWRLLDLPFSQTPVPAVLRGGCITTTYRTEEPCLIGSSLVDALRNGQDRAIAQIDGVERIIVTGHDDRRRDEATEVIVRIGSSMVSVRPRALVMAAGAGNHALLDLASAGRRLSVGRTSGAQQIRLAHMLVVRGPRERLPPLNGIFPRLGGLFIVSRQVGGADPATVWLVSDNQSPPLARPDDWLQYDARDWLRAVLPALEQLAPRLFAPAVRDVLEWGVYAAPKAEGTAGGELPNQPSIGQFGFSNVWAVWPTKLTLAPLASRLVADAIAGRLGAAGPAPASTCLERLTRRRPATAPERWEITAQLPWAAFARQHGVASVAAASHPGDRHE